MLQGKDFFPRSGLRRARRIAGMTQTRLARKLGLTSSAVNAWETGRRNPGDSVIPDLAEALGLTPTDLLDLIENPQQVVQV